MRTLQNEMRMKISALSENEGVCRAMVAAFIAGLDPNIEELADVKCAVSEAVTNCIVHAYGGRGGFVYISVGIYGDRLIRVEVRDRGCGIPDVAAAMRPTFTTDKSGERSGMGFSVMGSFMSRLRVYSAVGRGTRVVMWKRLS